MGQRDKDDPVLTEYVQKRLARLLAENRPRRAQPDDASRRPSGRPEGPPEFIPSDDGDIDFGVVEDPLGWAHRPAARRAPTPRDGSATVLDQIDDWTDPPQRRFNRTHVGVVVVLLILASLFAGWSVLRAHPVAIASTSVPPATSGPGSAVSPSGSSDPGAGGPSGSPRVPSSPVKKILVHVLGAVHRPGVVTLPERARVLDAIRAAGGLRREAAPGDLNLAQVLTDGEQVLIGTRAKPSGSVRDSSPTTTGSTDPGSDGAVLDLNGATETQLEELPGVGPVTAGKIVAWRTQHARFSRVEELQEVDGIGPKTYAQIAPHVRV